MSDRRMGELHWRFLRVRGPTDVLTFEHGEIVISTETAQRNAARFHTSIEHEIRLYLIHGLLHLHGFDDRTARAAKLMEKTQTRILVTLSKSR
ncbi:MAG: rRNA maturation RNase YbeY [Chthoniobacterales bacterium]|nr:rRNA maturation RNase YbeY [Chthoniobacterales bacterium]